VSRAAGAGGGGGGGEGDGDVGRPGRLRSASSGFGSGAAVPPC